MIILDFSKAFDKVPHVRLLNKLRLYGIDINTLQWIQSFLTGRTQKVVVDGCFSQEANVTSGVPQGTVLGPLLFLLFINDLPTVLHPDTNCRLFADDCLLYRTNKSTNDQLQLQKDLDALESWSKLWGMAFNAKKCNVMSISRSTTFTKFYDLSSTVLDTVDSCVYLGVTISNTRSWSEHVATLTKKANSKLGFLKRNLKNCPKQLKRTAYISLLRSQLEYGSSIWDPGLTKDINLLEGVQRRAARWVQSDYRTTSSVTNMLKELGMSSLQNRRKQQRLVLMFKIMNNLVGVPPDDLDLAQADGRTRSNHKFKLRCHRPTTKNSRHSYVNTTIPEWNSLPASLAEADSLSEFKSQLSRLLA